MANKILVIDDDNFIRDLYKEVLSDAGFTVDIAEDGKKGLEKLTHGGYSVVLLDVMMPEMDGLTVLSELGKKPPQEKNGPIILLTNLAQDPIIKEALTHGATSYLIKTDITPDQLVKEVKGALSQ